jgi:hypothetical protein
MATRPVDGLNRRELLIAIGGSTAALTGWLALPACRQAFLPAAPPVAPFRPRLANDVVVRRTGNGAELAVRGTDGRERVVCGLNEHGAAVVTALDGRNDIPALARALCVRVGSHEFARTEAAVVCFLAELSQAGLLAEPVIANVVAVEVRS